MSDPIAPALPPSRRRTGKAMLMLAGLAFVLGLSLMAVLVARFGWFAPAPPPVAAIQPKPVALIPTAAPVQQAAVDPNMLAARTAALSAQLATIEAHAASLSADVNAAAAQAGRAEALLVAFAARRAVDRGAPLGALDSAFRARFAAAMPAETGLIEEAAHHPVTLEELRVGLEALSSSLLGGGGWWSSITSELGSLVVIHRADAPSPAPADRIARIRRLIDAGQVEAALDEVGRLPGAPDAANWIAAARRYVAVHHALDTVETAAILAPPSPAPNPTRR